MRKNRKALCFISRFAVKSMRVCFEIYNFNAIYVIIVTTLNKLSKLITYLEKSTNLNISLKTNDQIENAAQNLVALILSV